MKKGCFLKSIIILTILVAVITYLAQNYFDDWVVKPGKGLLKNIALNDIQKRFETIKDTPEKDSLQLLINNYMESKINQIGEEDDSLHSDSISIRIGDDFKLNINKIKDTINYYLKDNVVDKNDLIRFKEFLKIK